MHTEKSIIQLLNGRFPRQNVEYKLTNSFIFKWESDFFIVQKASGYCYEIEIKISRSDFRADAVKVQKHQILKDGKYIYRQGKYDREANGMIYQDLSKECDFRPNRFYYCVPEGLILPHEIPSYAGLMYAKDFEIVTVKEAPLIHKNRLEIHKTLCPKYYNKFMDAKFELEQLRQIMAEQKIKI